MITGRVIGVCVATVKDQSLSGRKLLVVDMVKADGTVFGNPAIAVDLVGAGFGETVLMAKSRDASMAAEEAPVDLAIVGIVDEMTRPKHTQVNLSEMGFQIDRGQ